VSFSRIFVILEEKNQLKRVVDNIQASLKKI